MRDLEFLPTWYPALRRKKRLLVWQSSVVLGVILALCAELLAQHIQARRQEQAIEQYSRELGKTDAELAQLDQLRLQKRTLRAQQQALDKLGLHVETTRLFSALEAAMPREMALLGVTTEVDDGPPERRLNVRMQGVTPDDVQVATLLANLHGVKFFDDVDMAYVRDRFERGHSLREFEVSFSIHLGMPGNGN